MSKKDKAESPVKGSSCPIGPTQAEQDQIVAEWMKQIPPDVQASIKGLEAVELGIGMGPGCIAVHIEKFDSPRPLAVALDCLAANTAMMNRGHITLKHKLFWNVELKYIEPRCNKQIYTELDLVAQVKDKFYIFEIKCGYNLRIDKWVERANLFQDENTKFITSTAIDKLNHMIFAPYWLFTLQEIDEQFTKMLLKDFPD